MACRSRYHSLISAIAFGKGQPVKIEGQMSRNVQLLATDKCRFDLSIIDHAVREEREVGLSLSRSIWWA